MVKNAKEVIKVIIYDVLNINKKSLRGEVLYDLIICLITKNTNNKRMKKEHKNV